MLNCRLLTVIDISEFQFTLLLSGSWFNSTLSERAHFSAYMANHHPDQNDKPRPAPPDNLIHIQTHTLIPICFASLSPQPSTPSLLSSTLHLSSSVLPPMLLYLAKFLSLPSAVCSGVLVSERDMCIWGGGITCLCHRFPSGSR